MQILFGAKVISVIFFLLILNAIRMRMVAAMAVLLRSHRAVAGGASGPGARWQAAWRGSRTLADCLQALARQRDTIGRRQGVVDSHVLIRGMEPPSACRLGPVAARRRRPFSTLFFAVQDQDRHTDWSFQRFTAGLRLIARRPSAWASEDCGSRQRGSFMLLGIMILGMICLLASVGCGGGPRQERQEAGELTVLNFGIASTESTPGLRRGFDPLLADMSQSLGMEVKAFFAPDYAGIVEGMRFGKVDVARLGNKAAIEACDRAGAEVFAQTTDAYGLAGYWSVIIVHRDSPYKTLDDLIAAGRDLSFGNGDPNSTSGYLIPNHFLWSPRKLDPKQVFKRVVTANHEAHSLAVANRQLDAATNNTENLTVLKNSRPELADQLRVLWESPLIALDPLVWRKDLPDDIKGRVRKFIFSYGREGPDAARQRQILSNITSGWAPFRESSDEQLLPFREMLVAQELKDLDQQIALSPESVSRRSQLNAELDRLRAAVMAAQQKQQSTTVGSEAAGNEAAGGNAAVDETSATQAGTDAAGSGTAGADEAKSNGDLSGSNKTNAAKSNPE